MRKHFYTEKEIEEIINYVRQAKTKKQVKEFLEENDYRSPYIFFRLFSLKDEDIVKKLPGQLFSGCECRMLYYYFGEKGEKYYPAKKRDQTPFYRGNNLRMVEMPIYYSDYDKSYAVSHYIYDGNKKIGYAYTENYRSVKDWLLLDGNNLNGKWLYDVKIPKSGIKGIDFTGAYVRKEDSPRLKGSIPVEEKIIKKEYDAISRRFIVYYGYTDPDGKIVRNGDYQGFETFREFATFVKKDLSGGNYTGYDFSKIKMENYNFSNAVFDDPNKAKEEETPSTKLIEELQTNYGSLVATSKKLPIPYREEEYGTYCLYYISDLHIDHKIVKKCKNDADIDKYLTKKVQEISDSIDSSKNWYVFSPIIIVGDVSFSYELNCAFFTKLRSSVYNDIIVVLGNHELWYEDYQIQIEKYRKLFSSLGIVLLDNGLYTINKNPWNDNNKHYYSEEYLMKTSTNEIRDIVKDSHISFFGGIGFSGRNKDFNATNGIYRDALTREQEIEESKKFEKLYSKLVQAIVDKHNIAIVSHMPPKDWTSYEMNKNWIYIYGHNHRSTYKNDDNGVVLADNQVGYKERKFSLNRYIFNGIYDIFADYQDGIYNITAEEYKDFSYGKGIVMQYTTQKPVIMIKKNNVYMFMRKSSYGYSIMNGGVPNKVDNDPEYYYSRMDEQVNMILVPLKAFTSYQKQYSDFVKAIGGDGRIHGCIVDIDFFNHLYINPIDGSVTPYFATDIINKTVYKDVKSLLEDNCPKLLDNYRRQEKMLPAIQNNELIKKIPYLGTDIYKMSKKLRAMQYLENEGVLRCWYNINTNPYEIIEDNEAFLLG